MCLPTIINSAGLVIDIIGVILVYKYGIPNRSAETWRSEYDEPKEEKLKKISNYGMIFIGIGFFLQLISNWI